MLDSILITDAPFTFSCLTGMCSADRTSLLPLRGSKVCEREWAAFKDAHVCLISYMVQLLSLEASPVHRLVSLPQLLPQF